MKNVRVWFTKGDRCRYISHLDLNRVMLRAIQKSRLPVWHTEGFNVHPYIAFPLPLSLGFCGKRESMDMRILDDDYNLADIKDALNGCLPQGVKVFDVTLPVKKPSAINSALFHIKLMSDDNSVEEIYSSINELLSSPEIPVDKKTKKGIKTIDIKQYFDNSVVDKHSSCVSVDVTLPAGSTVNINPTLLINALEKKFDIQLYYDITRTDIFDEEGKRFE